MTAFSYTAAAGGSHAALAGFLKRWLPKAAALVHSAPAEVSIALVGHTKMASLHQEFLGVPGSTDVLSFELDHDARGRVIAGEVVICVPYAQREANRRGLHVHHELLLYALHGLLHLSGFDDQTAEDYARIHKKEDQILQRIGIGATFDRTAKRRSNAAKRRRAGLAKHR